jgi:hypothetical protein
MKKWLDTIWADFDSSDPMEWILLSFGYLWLVVILSVAIWK